MKKIILIAAVALSIASCHARFENNYTITRVEHDGQDYITTINAEANYESGQLIEVKGQAFKVLFANSTEIK